MSFIINTKFRTKDIEMMDNFSINGELLKDTLDKLDSINKFLGGNRVTISGLKKILENQPKERKITIIDLGCGSGEMLRKVAEFGKKNGYKFKLIGIDANSETVNYAKRLSQNYNDISFYQQNVFSNEFEKLSYDIVLSTLFLHHFNEDEIIKLLRVMLKKSTIGIVINDLHRHPVAYYLFKLLSLVVKNNMVKKDGLVSILRAFKRIDLEQIGIKLKADSSIKWHWAFRYQWILLSQNTVEKRTEIRPKSQNFEFKLNNINECKNNCSSQTTS